MDAKTKNTLEKEKQVINEIISYVENNKIILGTNEYNHFVMLLNKLFVLESTNYELRPNEVILSIKALSDSTTSGLCHENLTYTKDGKFIVNSTEIILNIRTHYFEELASDKKEYRVKSVNKIIENLYHEFTHLSQLRSIKSNISSERNLRNAKEYIYLEKGPNRIYRRNHNNFRIENEAELNAYTRYAYVMDSHYDKNAKLECLSKTMSSDFIINKGNKRIVVSREETIDSYIDFLITNQKFHFLLIKYPILQKEYNLNCTRKSLEELSKSYIQELTNLDSENLEYQKKENKRRNIKEMYFSLFNKALIYSSNDEIDKMISLLGIQILEEIIEYNNSKYLQEEKVLYELYSDRETKKSKYNFISRNYKKEFIIYQNGETYLKSFNEFKHDINFTSFTEEEQYKIDNYFISHIPECGYILNTVGVLMEPLEFFNKYFIPNMKHINTLNDYFNFLERYTLSESKLLFEIGKRRIRNQKQKQNYYIYEIIDRYKEKTK